MLSNSTTKWNYDVVFCLQTTNDGQSVPHTLRYLCGKVKKLF